MAFKGLRPRCPLSSLTTRLRLISRTGLEGERCMSGCSEDSLCHSGATLGHLWHSRGQSLIRPLYACHRPANLPWPNGTRGGTHWGTHDIRDKLDAMLCVTTQCLLCVRTECHCPVSFGLSSWCLSWVFELCKKGIAFAVLLTTISNKEQAKQISLLH